MGMPSEHVNDGSLAVKQPYDHDPKYVIKWLFDRVEIKSEYK
jgi:hypothetical protein